MKILSWFCNNPKPLYIELIKYILWYISIIRDWNLRFDKEIIISNDMIRYTNSDITKLKTDWKLIEDYVFILIEAIISYLSKLKSIVILLTYEVEYIIIYKIEKKIV